MIEHLAELASLTLDKDEAEALAMELETIIRYVDALQAIDVEGVPPTTSMGSVASMRADEPQPGLTHEDALAGAPQVEGEGFAVPTFVEQ